MAYLTIVSAPGISEDERMRLHSNFEVSLDDPTKNVVTNYDVFVQQWTKVKDDIFIITAPGNPSEDVLAELKKWGNEEEGRFFSKQHPNLLVVNFNVNVLRIPK